MPGSRIGVMYMQDLILFLKDSGYSVEVWNDVPDILDVFGNGFSGFLYCLNNGYAALCEYDIYPFFSSNPLEALCYAAKGYTGIKDHK